MTDTSPALKLRKALISAYAEAYHKMGYSTLMGKIVALLLISPEPLSLDEICEQLEMSKGPVSQITRRLRDHHLIEKHWVPGERKDYYRAADDIFGNAFRNYRTSMRRNRDLARQFMGQAESLEGSEGTYLKKRMHEMLTFYELMEQHNQLFLAEWAKIFKDEPAKDR
jgi:DNA-binding transcriptional regulator GbsR (MarR family)